MSINSSRDEKKRLISPLYLLASPAAEGDWNAEYEDRNGASLWSACRGQRHIVEPQQQQDARLARLKR